MYNYVATPHKSSLIDHCVTGHFLDKEELNLIVSKGTRLEILKTCPEGLEPVFELPIYGKITTMNVYRPPGEELDRLFVSTEKYDFIVLSYSPEIGEIVTNAKGTAQDRIGQPTTNGHTTIIDPDCRVIGLHLYDGLFKVIPFDEKHSLNDAFNIRMEEITIHDIVFLHAFNGIPCTLPTIAVLYEDTKECRHIKTYQISLREKEFLDGPFSQANVDNGAAMLIPLPTPYGGVLIIGEETIAYINGTSAKLAIGIEPTTILSFGKIDPDGSRWLLGDAEGKLLLLVVQTQNDKVTDLKLELLGETSISSAISYLDNGVVFIGSSSGDHQLIQLHPEKDEHGTYIEVLESYTNLAPIVDFQVVDLDRQGQGQVVTCSGNYKDGSLRIIRSGIGIHEEATAEIPGIKGLWPLRQSFESSESSYLVMSFIGDLRVMGIEEDVLGEIEIESLQTDAQTLCIKNTVGDMFVQVTEEGLRLIECNSHKLADEWKTDQVITVASANPTQVVIATKGGHLIYFELEDKKIVEKRRTTLENEISCIDINPIGEDKTKSSFVVVGMWTENAIRILSLSSLETVESQELGSDFLPRSALITTFENTHYVLCGVGDGHLFNFTFDLLSGKLSEKKKVAIGTQPVMLSTFYSKGAEHVFAATDRPTVIYSNNNKLLYSNVNLKDVNFVAPFRSESLAIATEESLMIGMIDDIQKLHIRKIPLGQQPKRISYQAATNTFLVATATFDLNDNSEEKESHFLKLIDDQTFEVLTEHGLEATEQVSSIMSAQFADDPTHYYVVGTAFVNYEEPEPSKGRIIVFEAIDGKLSVVVDKEVKGGVLEMQSFNKKLLVAVNTKVILYKWHETGTGLKELEQECSQGGHVWIVSLQTRGDFILVGDIVKSVTLLVYKPEDGNIQYLAKDHTVVWTMATYMLDDETFVGCDTSHNLLMWKKNVDGTTDEELRKLNTEGKFHLGDQVNRFREGSLVMRMPESNPLSSFPSIVYGTVTGAIGILVQLPKEEFVFLKKVQKAFNQVVSGIGDLSHDHWRAFQAPRQKEKAKAFIDGDLVESFLTLTKDQMKQIAEELQMPLPELVNKIEDLARLH